METAGILCIINNIVFIANVTVVSLPSQQSCSEFVRVVIVASADALYLSSGLLSSSSESELTAPMYLRTRCSFSDWIL